MKFILISAFLFVGATAGATSEFKNDDNFLLKDKLNVLSTELERRIKLDLPRIIDSKDFRAPTEVAILEILLSRSTSGRFLHRSPILKPSPFPPLIPLPDLRLIKFDFDIIWGNISFWDQTLGGLNDLADYFVASEVDEGYRVNYSLGFPKVSFSGQYDIDITANLSTGPVILVLSLIGNGDSYISFDTITVDLQIDFGKQPDSELVKVGALLHLNGGSTSVGFENLRIVSGSDSVVIPPGSLDPIVTPAVSTILSILGPLVASQIIQPLVQNQYKNCTLQETIDFFTGVEGSNLFCAIPLPTPDPNPGPTTTLRPTLATTPSEASRIFQNLFLNPIMYAILLLRATPWISNLIS